MNTVKEVSRLTGVSIRTLHHYDAIGLLKPTAVTQAGYRLYDDAALERLYLILLFRELGLSLKEIGAILELPDEARNRVLERRIQLMQKNVQKLQNSIHLANMIQVTGVKYMDFQEFDPKKMDDERRQAQALYGKTQAWQEYSQKAKGRSKSQEQALGDQVMDFFRRLGQMMPCDPGCEAARNWARELQAFFTAHYYTCTPQILGSLAQAYAGGGSMNENIDKAGGPGTGAFAKEVIDLYISSL